MTDEQIIKALEYCGNIVDSTCKECDYHETYNASCVVRLMRDALDLYNRQKAEIAKKDTEIDILIRKKESLRDEICKLQNEVGHWKRTADYNAQKYAELIKEMVGDADE